MGILLTCNVATRNHGEREAYSSRAVTKMAACSKTCVLCVLTRPSHRAPTPCGTRHTPSTLYRQKWIGKDDRTDVGVMSAGLALQNRGISCQEAAFPFWFGYFLARSQPYSGKQARPASTLSTREHTASPPLRPNIEHEGLHQAADALDLQGNDVFANKGHVT